MKIPDGYRMLLRVKGIDLAHLGLNEVALHREDALKAAGLLQEAGIAILGGDVYIQRRTGIETAYANWHSNQAANEDYRPYVVRSCRETEAYIRAFPQGDETPIFVLVPNL